MNILLLGSGGREHALAWKLAASPLLERLYCAPGNAGIAQEAECVALDHRRPRGGDRVLPSEQDRPGRGRAGGAAGAPASSTICEAAGIKAFGPSKAAARLEGSKGFTKDLCRANDIPTAAYERFTMPRPREGLCARAGRADRGQGRRPRGRQGRGRRRDASTRPRPRST